MEPITIETILATFKNFTESKRPKEIKEAVVKSLTPPDTLINPDQVDIEKQVERVLKEDRSHGDESELKFYKGKYSKRKKRRIGEETLQKTEYVGRAGECAVMSELIFRGYNANRMMIDEGVDVIAVKDNIYYYIQVKTTFLKDEKVYCRIDFDRFNQYQGAQIRYIIVVRYKKDGEDRNMFFLFTPDKLQDAIYQHCLKKSDDCIYLKIKFHEKTGRPLLYDEREMDVSFNMNRLEL